MNGKAGNRHLPIYHYPEEVVTFTTMHGETRAVLKKRLNEFGRLASNQFDLAKLSELDGIEGCAVEIVPSAKMSKSKNNVVDPVNIIEAFGADTARWFVLSDSPPERDVEWTAAGAEASAKHLARVHATAVKICEMDDADGNDDDLLRTMHKAIHDVTMGVESFGFNAAIAKLYAYQNAVSKSKAGGKAQKLAMRTMAQLMSPMTPHLSEEIWSMLGGEGLVAQAPWPKADEAMLVDDTVTMPIQINGKRRAEISVPKDMDKDEVEKLALSQDAVIRVLDGSTPKESHCCSGTYCECRGLIAAFS